MPGIKDHPLVVVFLFVILCHFSWSYQNETGAQEDAVKTWTAIRQSTLDTVDSITKRILPLVLSVGYDSNVSGPCMGSLLKLFNGLRNIKMWAVSMLDSNGRLLPGMFAGTLTDLGDYDLCLSLNDEGPWSKKTFVGQYCTVEVRLPLPPIPRKIGLGYQLINFTNIAADDEVYPLVSKWLAVFYRLPIRAGLCVPSTCTREDVKEIGKTVVNLVIPQLEVQVPSCEIESPATITKDQILVLSCFGALLILTAICTTVDVITKRQSPAPRFRRHFRHFSLWSNAAKYFKTEENTTGHLKVLDGIRWWSMAWICYTHTYGLFKLQSVGRLLDALEMLKRVWFGIIQNAWVSVDVFFLLGGILVAYTTLGQLQRDDGRLNFFKNIFRRLWRLSPGLWTVIAFIFLLPLFGSGPLWNEIVNHQVEICKDTWWLAGLYANSWLGHANACLVSTWYVSADLHLYVISPIFIYIFYKNRTFGFMLCLLAIFASCSTVFILNVHYDLYPYVMMMTFNEETTEEVFTTVYFRPYTHVGPYMVGILLGCFMKTYQKLNLRWYVVATGWCISTGLALSVLLGPYNWALGAFPSAFVGSLYQALHKTAFALSVGWVVWACSYGYGGVVTNLLGWPGYKKLSQLTYLIYLIQLPVLWTRVGSLRRIINFSHYNFFTEFTGNFTISTILALFIHLLIEAPFISMDSAMFPKPAKKAAPSPAPTVNGQGIFSSEKTVKHSQKNIVVVECLQMKPLPGNEKELQA